MGHDWSMSENPTSTSQPDEPDDATRVFAPGSAAPSPGAPSSQSSAPTWRSTTSASSSAPTSNPVPGWRGASTQTPASASSASAASSPVSGSSTGSWGHQQPTASQPQSAPSWGGAPGRPSAQQPAASQPAQPWGGQNWGQQGQSVQGGYAAQQALYAAPAPAHRDGLRALFDLSFTEMVTPLVVKILYVLSMVVGILWWLFAILIGTGAASIDPYFNSGSSVMLVLGILLGWIPGVIIVLGTRMISEFVLSSLKTQRAAEDILKRLESQ